MMGDYLRSLGFIKIANQGYEWFNPVTGEFISFDHNQWHWGMVCSAVQDWPSFHYKRFKHLIKGC